MHRGGMDGVPRGLVESINDSPSIVYVKSLDGRYLHVNPRYQEFFEIGEADVLGRADSELAAGATIDGPRMANGGAVEGEPLQLEYTVAPFEGRPALAVWRFAVGAPGEDAAAICAVAAPVAEASRAREECGRLMALAQSNNGTDERAEDDGRIAALHEASAMAARRAHELLGELTGERELREQAEEALAAADKRIADLERALATDRAPERADDEELRHKLAHAEEAIAAARARSEEAETALSAERARSEEAESALAAERTRAHAAQEAVAAERARSEEAESSARRQREVREQSVAQLQSELNAARMELQSAKSWVASERDRAEAAQEALAAERERAGSAEARLRVTRQELQVARAELVSEREQRARAEHETGDSVESMVVAERARADQAEAAACREQEAREVLADQLQSQLNAVQAELKAARAELASERDHRTQSESAHSVWDAAAQRALTTALIQASDWRTGAKAAIGVLGIRGGWDAVCVWRPEDRHPLASCVAMWTDERRRLTEFETATWQRRQPLSGLSIGQAFAAHDTRWLTPDPEAEDRRLQLLAHHGMRGALIVAVSDGARVVAALELLSLDPTPPSADLTASIEAVALQLGHYWHLLLAGNQPKWRFGRT
jgi:hypothetical protein